MDEVASVQYVYIFLLQWNIRTLIQRLDGQHIGPDRRTPYSSGSRTSPYGAAYANRWAEFASTHEVVIGDLHCTPSRSSDWNDTTEVTNELIPTSSGGQSGLRPMASKNQTSKGNSRNRVNFIPFPQLPSMSDIEANRTLSQAVRTS
jgi:hypothetical protein